MKSASDTDTLCTACPVSVGLSSRRSPSPPAASLSGSLPKTKTAVIIPKKSRTQTTRKNGSPRPGNCGRQRGTSIETMSEKPAKPAAARASPTLCPVERPSRSTAATYHGSSAI